MIFSLIVARGLKNEIGIGNELPWGRSLPADLARFKELTVGKPVIMGRKTYESIPKKFRPLPDRQNIVLTRQQNPDFADEGCDIANFLEEAMYHANGADEVMIAGGSEIYEEFLPAASKIYLTIVHESFPEADAFFPELDENYWQLKEKRSHEANENNKYDYSFLTLIRK